MWECVVAETVAVCPPAVTTYAVTGAPPSLAGASQTMRSPCAAPSRSTATTTGALGAVAV